MKLTVISGNRDPKCVEAEDEIKGLIRHGASFRIEGRLFPVLPNLNLHLTDLKTLLLRFRIDTIEAQGESQPPEYVGVATTLESSGDDYIVMELAVRVTIEGEGGAKRIAVLDIGERLTERT
jgi:hypothetical protein